MFRKLFGRSRQEEPPPGEGVGKDEPPIPFHLGLFELLGLCAMADGDLNTHEIGELERIAVRLALSEEDKAAALEALRNVPTGPAILKGRIFRFYWSFRMQPDKIEQALEETLRLALVDGPLNVHEEHIIEALLKGVGGSPHKFSILKERLMIERFGPPKKKGKGARAVAGPPPERTREVREALEILGCRESAKLSEVKSNYKKLVKRCHPDRMDQRKMSEDDKMRARREYMKIQGAYDLLIKALR